MRSHCGIFPRVTLAAMAVLTALLGLSAWLATSILDRDNTTDEIAVEGTPSESSPIRVVVIDAGHGGEDAGASGAAGLMEKEVNLAVAFALRDVLEAAGIPTVMTRTEDKLLYDRNVDYQGRKKVLDLAARLNIAEATEECLFISIHMNAFPQAQYNGLQVWYSPHDPRSARIAEAVQTAAVTLQPDNHRKIKAAGSNIFLLDNLDTPAILVECGFLSNPEEAERLANTAYQRQVALAIFAGIVGYMR